MNPPPNLPPHNIPLGHPRAPAPSMLYPASDIDWWFDSLHDSIHVTMPFSQIIPPSPSPSESKSPLYTSVSFLLSCIQGRHCHLSKFHIYVLVYCIGVFLSGLLHSVNRLQFHPSHQNWFKWILFNGWVILHCVYVPQLSYLFICWWTSRLLPCPGYDKQCCDEHWDTCVSFNSGNILDKKLFVACLKFGYNGISCVLFSSKQKYRTQLEISYKSWTIFSIIMYLTIFGI